MIKELSLSLAPEIAYSKENLNSHIAKQLHISKKDISDIEILKRSIDARKGRVQIQLRLNVFINEEKSAFTPIEYNEVKDENSVVIVGSGPAG